MPAENFRPGRTIKLTTPFMTGDDVSIIQRRLGEKLIIDGEYGRATASAVREWKYRAGFPAREVNTGIGVDGQRILFGQKPRSLAMKARTRLRMPKIREMAKARAAQATLASRMVNSARAYIGQKENPAGSNKVPSLMQLAKERGLAGFYVNMGWPWCAFFTGLMGLINNSVTCKDGFAGKFNILYTVDILQKATDGEYGMRVISSTQVEAGDWVMMNFPGGDARVDHIGMSTGRVTMGAVPTIEGNTSVFGSQSNGGEVCVKNRPLSEVRAFIRIS